MATPRHPCTVVVNGRLHEFDRPVHTNALDFLRGCGLTGCKEGCAEGECGACAVLIARPDGSRTRWTAINACLIPAATLDGQEVITAEGLGSPDDLHPVQHEMAVRGGSQCGYCTPGFVCSMAAEFYRAERSATGADQGDGEYGPNGFDLEALSGNLCRCTGYRPIRDAAYALGEPHDDPLAERQSRPAPGPIHTDLRAPDGRFVRPESLAEAVALVQDDAEARIVAGATDWGVDVNLRGTRAETTIAIDRLPELRTVNWSDSWVDVGAAVTLSELERELDGRLPLLEQLFPQFASRLIRNGATLGGNIGTGSPIGDAPPALLALEASVVLASVSGERQIPLSEYFTGYRQSVRRADELIKTIRIPLPVAPVTAFHKIAKRRFDDISSVAVAYALTITEGVIVRARIGLGGVAATPILATATMAALEGRPWNRDTVHEAQQILITEGTPLDDHRASARYRSATLGTSLERLYDERSDLVPAGERDAR